MKKIAVLPDLHCPYHDPQAYGLFLKVMADWKPDILVVIGDFADFKAVSRYPAPPDPTTFMEEILNVNKELDKLNGIGKRRIFLCGNHERRLESYLIKNAPELYGMMTVPGLLELERRGFEYYDYQEEVVIGDITFVHDIGYATVNALRQTLQAYPANIVTGHTHRFGMVTVGDLKRDTYTSVSFGWLGDSKKIDYLPSIKVKMDWTKGFGLVLLEPDGTPHINPIKITKGKCLVDGKVYK